VIGNVLAFLHFKWTSMRGVIASVCSIIISISIHVTINAGGGNFPSFPEAGPSTLKRKYAEISVDSDDDSDGSE
jgi:hypothetical protein